MALDALLHAVDDLRAFRGHLFGNVGTGALWSAVLDEELEDDLGAEYAALRDAEAPLLHGLVHARNGVMHAALVAADAGGLSVPLVTPLVVGPPTWRTSAALHVEWTPRGFKSPIVQHRIAMYDEHLSGQDPTETLQAAFDFFLALSGVNWEPSSYVRP